MTKHRGKNKSGYALLETIFYVSIFVIFSVAIIDSMIVMTKSFRETSLYTTLTQGSNIMERISREIRGASSINTISTSSLKLNTTDSAGTAKTIEFSLSGTDIRLLDNNAFVGNLNSGNIKVTAITFTQINTTTGSAVRIFMTIQSNNRNENFYDTVVLRRDY